MIEVRRIRSGEWERLRDIRLEALEDTPSAFATTLAEAEAYPDSLWQERAVAGAAGDDQIIVVAVSGDRTVGMTIALGRPENDFEVVPIVSVYVSPSIRRQRVAARLLRLAEEWVRAKGGSRTSLWVEEQNVPAQRFYESIGYTATLDRHMMKVSTPTWEVRFEKTLRPFG
jgi:ribosomal protein S18 acetylase RimI-like enzyme